MDRLSPLTAFFNKTARDSRIGIAHIGLYITLLQMRSQQEGEGPLITYGTNVMQVAKISSSATYHKLIRELNDYGYISYIPSYYKGKGSCIYL